MYRVEYFVEFDPCDLQHRINDWLSRRPHIIPISISVNDKCDEAMLLYKEEEQ